MWQICTGRPGPEVNFCLNSDTTVPINPVVTSNERLSPEYRHACGVSQHRVRSQGAKSSLVNKPVLKGKKIVCIN